MTEAAVEVAAADNSPAARHMDCDVLIVGGGLVGSALAVALADTPIRTVLVEKRDPKKLEQPSFDSRVTALANGSARILRTLGFAQVLETHAEPITAIHVSERGHFGAARFRAREEGVDVLGYTLENRALGEALWKRIGAASNCTVLAPAGLTAFEARPAGVRAEIEDDNGQRLIVNAGLLVGADGAHSAIRSHLGITAREDHYEQKAIILNCMMELPHCGVAHERFMQHGPLAVLPLTGGRAGVVWTMPTAMAEELTSESDASFTARLQDAFGFRLGKILRIGTRSAHELSRVRSDSLGLSRAVLVGNAAVSLHPAAAQGFNLALRDVASLAEILAEQQRSSKGGIGRTDILRRYSAWRVADQRKVAAFTHNLVGLFGIATPGFGGARGLGLLGFDVLPGAKAMLARHTMGLAGRLPRLARGLKLE